MLEDEMELKLSEILDSCLVGDVLVAISKLPLADCWLAGGAVRNTVWRAIFGASCELGINDFDVVFFDRGGDRQQELLAKEELERQFPSQIFDVKNQASFGVWRPWKKTFTSTYDGVSNWLHTATAVGVRLKGQGISEILAPYGLADLFDGIVRPTAYHVANPEATAKAATFLEKCPSLRLVDGVAVELAQGLSGNSKRS